MIPYGRQEINQEDIDSIIKVLKSDFLTQGPTVENFESKVINNTNSKYAIALNSATSALHLSCLALGLKKGDWLWTSPISFVASANCGIYCGAFVDFVDIDPKTYNLSIRSLEAKLELAKKNNSLPKIIIPVHLSGQSCEMKEIYELSKIYGFKIIEDASHAIGGFYYNKPIGCCEFSDVTVFSFHPVKLITTAEGGMSLTNDEDVANKIRLLRSHGITRNPKFMTSSTHGDWYYQQITLGYNYRMNDIQAALGISQLSRLKSFIKRRRFLSKRYDKNLDGLPLTIPWQHSQTESARHLYIIRLNLKAIKLSRKEIYNLLKKEEIGVNIHYIPIHTQPYYIKLGFKNGQYPEAEKYYKEAISLPLYPGLTEKNQNHIINTLKKILK